VTSIRRTNLAVTPGWITASAVRRKLAALFAPVLAVVVAGCASAPVGPVPINTGAPSTVCAMARVGGILVYDTTYGLGFKSGDSVRVVVWPNGYSARREQDGVVVLIDPSGQSVAREGDTIVAAGANGDTAVYVECYVEVNPSPAS
jgi:hypothetical protein